MPTTPAETSPEPEAAPQTGAEAAWRVHRQVAREPWVVDTAVSVSAPALAIAGFDGQIRTAGHGGFRTAHGHYYQDRRVLSRSELTIDDAAPEYLGHRLLGASASKHVCVVRTSMDPTPDPVLLVERIHQAGQGESIKILSSDVEARELCIRLQVAADLADVSEVRRGQPGAHATVEIAPEGLCALRWRDAQDGAEVSLRIDPAATVTLDDGLGATVEWKVEVEPGKPWFATLSLDATPSKLCQHTLQAVTVDLPWNKPAATSDERLDALVEQGLADLQALFLAPTDRPQDVFIAAGAPWYLTLFGRDSLWASRMLLPVDRDCAIALGTLRTLAALQGSKEDRGTDEQPGKILHELRRSTTQHQQGEILPPVYYGSMDATPLFVLLLCDVHRRRPDDEEVRSLIPQARAAVAWMYAQAAEDSAGFLRYEASREGAPANHGWKDSFDSIVSSGGLRASGAIALSEVQAYAVEAAYAFADLLEALGEADSAEEIPTLRTWADKLRQRFQKNFLVSDGEVGNYFAIALDGRSKVVDGLTSNLGHLLGTGILTSDQAAQTARQLVSEQLYSGWGLRTRSSKHARFNPFSYHGGAVWAHDTAIAIRGLSIEAGKARAADRDLAAGVCAEAARKLSEGLLSAAKTFDYRLPELFSGGTREPGDAAPLPFPAACRPQAWSAAAGIAVWAALDSLAGPPAPGPSPVKTAWRRLRNTLITDRERRGSSGSTDAFPGGTMNRRELTNS